VLKERCIHLEKRAYLGRTIEQTLSGLSIVVFLLVGHYPYYESPDLTIIKASKYWFSLWGFLGVSTRKYVSCVRDFGFLI
jgi:hypothetical protein